MRRTDATVWAALEDWQQRMITYARMTKKTTTATTAGTSPADRVADVSPCIQAPATEAPQKTVRKSSTQTCALGARP